MDAHVYNMTLGFEVVSTHGDIVKACEEFVRTSLEKNDASHDFSHIERVRDLALNLAKESNVLEGDLRLEIIELSSLLHDVLDWKYSGSDTAGVNAAREFLDSYGYPIERRDAVLYVIENVSFRKEISKNKMLSSSVSDGDGITPLAIVQDADRLDAIGAIGIARCFTYGGAKRSKMFDPNMPPIDVHDRATYDATAGSTTINHFYEKLFKIRDMMKTPAGRSVAQERHQYMLEFVDRFKKEWIGLA